MPCFITVALWSGFWVVLRAVFRGDFVHFVVVLDWFLFYFLEIWVCLNSRTVFSHK